MLLFIAMSWWDFEPAANKVGDYAYVNPQNTNFEERMQTLSTLLAEVKTTIDDNTKESLHSMISRGFPYAAPNAFGNLLACLDNIIGFNHENPFNLFEKLKNQLVDIIQTLREGFDEITKQIIVDLQDSTMTGSSGSEYISHKFRNADLIKAWLNLS